MAIKWELPWGNSNFWESLLAAKPITIFFVYLTTKVALSKKAGSWNVYFWPFLPSTSRHKSCKVLGRWFLGFQLRGLFTIYWIQLFNFIYTEKLPADFFITRHLFKRAYIQLFVYQQINVEWKQVAIKKLNNEGMQQNHYAMNICASENKIPWKIPGKFFRRPKPAAEKTKLICMNLPWGPKMTGNA